MKQRLTDIQDRRIRQELHSGEQAPAQPTLLKAARRLNAEHQIEVVGELNCAP